MLASPWIIYLAPTAILLAGIVDDLRSQKVHNWLTVSAAVFAVFASYFVGGWAAVQAGFIAAGAALLLCMPLVLSGILGGGDLKLLVAFSLASQFGAVIQVVIYALIWGAVLGLTMALVRREGLSVLKNISTILTSKTSEREKLHLHKIPFTVAIFLGWLTYLSLASKGGAL